MSETIIDPGRPNSDAHTLEGEDRVMSAVNYALMLAGHLIGVTTFIALIIAYARKDQASGWMRSHYEYQIHTFWMIVIGLVACGVMMITIILAPIALLVLALLWVWALVRTIVGLVRLLQGRGFDDPQGNWA